MKPLSLEFQALGPYKGYEKIDFEGLSKGGVFLIDGETGSGKTMILDAMCFALYGESSGTARDDLKELRCNRCDPSDTTYVRFTFEEKGKIYRFERRLVFKRKNLSKEQSASVLKGGIYEPIFENCRERDMNAKAEEIIGLDCDQFRQVFILPQGKFEKLLLADSEDKEDILSNIFSAGQWQGYADKYYERAKAEKDRLDGIRRSYVQSLNEEGCDTADELNLRIKDISEELEEDEARFRAAGYDGRQKILESQKALAADFRTLHEYEAEMKGYEERREEIREKEAALEMAEKAEAVFIPFNEMLVRLKEHSDRRKALENANAKIGTAAKDLEAAESEVCEYEKENEKYKDIERFATDLELRRSAYEAYGRLKEEEEAALNLLEAAKKNEELLESRKEKALKTLTRANYDYDEAGRRTKEARDSYVKGIAGHLAAGLEEGKPCPVCGSTQHPVKAPLAVETATEEDIEAAERAEKIAKSSWDDANEEVKKIDTELLVQRDELLKRNSDHKRAETNRINAENSLIKGIADMSALNRRIQDLRNEVKDYEKRGTDLRKKAEDAVKELSSAKTARKAAETEFKNAEEALENARQVFSDAIEGTGFAHGEDTFPYRKNEKERTALHKEIDSYYANLDHTRGLLEKKAKELEGKAEPDCEAIERELSAIAEAKDEHLKKSTVGKAELARLKDKYESISKADEDYQAHIAAAEDDLIFAKNLRGDSGIGLQRYVLGIMFSSVIAAANDMLSKVHGGRYRLFRTNEKVGSERKSGLNLKVYDSYGGGPEGRGVSTLSGGEKFLTSLALSIGMSAVARTGGVNIEGLFIDEGFGTLDSDSIDDAMEILASVQRSSGMVGIISHLDILRDNIPTQIHVIKGRDTSTIG